MTFKCPIRAAIRLAKARKGTVHNIHRGLSTRSGRPPKRTSLWKRLHTRTFWLVTLTTIGGLGLIFLHDNIIRSLVANDTDPWQERSTRNEGLNAFLGVTGTVYALVFGFTFQIVAERFKTVKAALFSETSSLSQIILLVKTNDTDRLFDDMLEYEEESDEPHGLRQDTCSSMNEDNPALEAALQEEDDGSTEKEGAAGAGTSTNVMSLPSIQQNAPRKMMLPTLLHTHANSSHSGSGSQPRSSLGSSLGDVDNSAPPARRHSSQLSCTHSSTSVNMRGIRNPERELTLKRKRLLYSANRPEEADSLFESQGSLPGIEPAEEFDVKLDASLEEEMLVFRTKLEVYQKLLKYIKFTVTQELVPTHLRNSMCISNSYCTAGNVPFLMDVIPLLKNLAGGAYEDVERLLIQSIFEEVKNVIAARKSRLSYSEQQLSLMFWAGMQILAFIAFLGIVLVSTGSEQIDLIIQCLALLAAIIMTLILADYDSPFDGLQQVSACPLLSVASDLHDLIDNSKACFRKKFHIEADETDSIATNYNSDHDDIEMQNFSPTAESDSKYTIPSSTIVGVDRHSSTKSLSRARRNPMLHKVALVNASPVTRASASAIPMRTVAMGSGEIRVHTQSRNDMRKEIAKRVLNQINQEDGDTNAVLHVPTLSSLSPPSPLHGPSRADFRELPPKQPREAPQKSSRP